MNYNNERYFKKIRITIDKALTRILQLKELDKKGKDVKDEIDKLHFKVKVYQDVLSSNNALDNELKKQIEHIQLNPKAFEVTFEDHRWDSEYDDLLEENVLLKTESRKDKSLIVDLEKELEETKALKFEYKKQNELVIMELDELKKEFDAIQGYVKALEERNKILEEQNKLLEESMKHAQQVVKLEAQEEFQTKLRDGNQAKLKYESKVKLDEVENTYISETQNNYMSVASARLELVKSLKAVNIDGLEEQVAQKDDTNLQQAFLNIKNDFKSLAKIGVLEENNGLFILNPKYATLVYKNYDQDIATIEQEKKNLDIMEKIQKDTPFEQKHLSNKSNEHFEKFMKAKSYSIPTSQPVDQIKPKAPQGNRNKK